MKCCRHRLLASVQPEHSVPGRLDHKHCRFDVATQAVCVSNPLPLLHPQPATYIRIMSFYGFPPAVDALTCQAPDCDKSFQKPGLTRRHQNSCAKYIAWCNRRNRSTTSSLTTTEQGAKRRRLEADAVDSTSGASGSGIHGRVGRSSAHLLFRGGKSSRQNVSLYI